MAFEDCYPVTLKLCDDCVQHIEYGEGSCCHEPHHGDPRPHYILRNLPPVDPFADDRPCATAVRLERRHRDVVAFTGGCHADAADACEADERCADNPDGSGALGYYASDCEGCGGEGHGDRHHYTAWIRRDTRPTRTFQRRGWTVSVHPNGARFYAMAVRHGGRTRYLFAVRHNGAGRYGELAAFVASLPAVAYAA